MQRNDEGKRKFRRKKIRLIKNSWENKWRFRTIFPSVILIFIIFYKLPSRMTHFNGFSRIFIYFNFLKFLIKFKICEKFALLIAFNHSPTSFQPFFFFCALIKILIYFFFLPSSSHVSSSFFVLPKSSTNKRGKILLIFIRSHLFKVHLKTSPSSHSASI